MPWAMDFTFKRVVSGTKLVGRLYGMHFLGDPQCFVSVERPGEPHGGSFETRFFICSL